jgi:hypothetical protein
MVGTQLERLPKGEGDDQLAGVGSVLEIACECGRSGCAATRKRLRPRGNKPRHG